MASDRPVQRSRMSAHKQLGSRWLWEAAAPVPEGVYVYIEVTAYRPVHDLCKAGKGHGISRASQSHLATTCLPVKQIELRY